MSNQYNQWTAMWAIAKAALRSIFKSPQAIFFSLFFPIVLIMVFGALTGGGGISIDIAFDSKADTTSHLYRAIRNYPVFDVAKGTPAELQDRLMKGRITAVINISKQAADTGRVKYDVHLRTTEASQRELPILKSMLEKIIEEVNAEANPVKDKMAVITTEEVKGYRPYKMIDFYLPGMIGFSLIGSAIFGVAFVFFSLRETLVLKRMFSTPVKKGYIVLGEGIARVLFQLATVIVLIAFGKFFYGFTLAHGWVTFFEMLALSLLGLAVFMGIGFIISSIAKNQNVIPIYANLIMFPQYFLSGTFFPKSALPAGMQKIINFLPLTALNDAMRKISFEGLHIWEVWKEVSILGVWCVITYLVLIKVFRWE